MNSLCIDASVWIASLNKQESFHSTAVRFLEKARNNGFTLVIPEICLIECVASIARSGVMYNDAIKIRDRLLILVDLIVPLSVVFEQAIEIAAKLKLRSADSIYAATAKHEKSPLITLDQEILDRCSWSKMP